MQTLYGILNEKLGLMDKAGTQYMDAVGKDLAQINESYATQITPDLNDLYSLRPILRPVSEFGSIQETAAGRRSDDTGLRRSGREEE